MEVEQVTAMVSSVVCFLLVLSAGLARASDYRDELEELVRSRFGTRRAFCEATGLSEDMVSHVLARRKHLAIDTLTEALGRIGCALHIVPLGDDDSVKVRVRNGNSRGKQRRAKPKAKAEGVFELRAANS